VRKIERVTSIEARLDIGPLSRLAGIGYQELDDRGAFGRFLKREQRFTRNPSVGDRLFPVHFVARPLADDDTNPVVPHVQSLRGPLHAISEYGYDLFLQHLFGFGKREFFFIDNLFPSISEFHPWHIVLSPSPGNAIKDDFPSKLQKTL